MRPLLGTVMEVVGYSVLQTVSVICPVMLLERFCRKKMFEIAARRLEDLPEVDLSDGLQLLDALKGRISEGRLDSKEHQLVELAYELASIRHLSPPYLNSSRFVQEKATGDSPRALVLAPVAGKLSVPSTLLCNVALGEDGTIWWQELDEGPLEVPRHFNYARGSKEGIARSLRGEIGRLGASLTENKWLFIRFLFIDVLTVILQRWLNQRHRVRVLANLRAQREAFAADGPVQIGVLDGTGVVVPLNRQALWEDNGRLWTTDAAGGIVPYIPIPEDDLPGAEEDEDRDEAGAGGEELDRAALCTICWARVRRAAFLDCGHRVCCVGCARRVAAGPARNCPMCSQPIKRVVRIYDP